MITTLLDKKETIEEDVEKLVSSADVLINNTISKINYELINLYWAIGKLVNDYRKENNSSYGDSVYTVFAEELRIKYGKGFTRRNINNMCLFNKIFSKLAHMCQFRKYKLVAHNGV